MSKRKISDCESDISYVVIETTDKKGGVFVQFIPRSWLLPLKKNSEIIVRAMAQFYFPRRLSGQSISQHIKFVKSAKFSGMEPQNETWELQKCRVLKIGLACFDDAIAAEKMFSDFFDTTEAEKELQRSPQAKRIRKLKRPAKKVQRPVSSHGSDSENEISGATEGVSDYNTVFQTIQDDDDDVLNEDVNLNNTQTMFSEELQVNVQNPHAGQPACEQPIIHFVQNDVAQMYPQGTVLQLLDQNEQEIQNEFAAAQHLEISSNGCSCKGLEKIRNKIDYFQKRMMNEMAEFRHEVRKSMRNLTDIVLRTSKTELDQEDYEHVDMFDDLSEKYKEIEFPVNDKAMLRSTDRRLKADADFKMFLHLKMERTIGKDPTKTARKMLNSICSVNCFSQFTWGGNPKMSKDCFSELESLIELMVKILEKRYPKCGAYNIIELVVKQRAKSAGEAMKENVKTSIGCKTFAAINENQHLDTEHMKKNVEVVHDNVRDAIAVNTNQELAIVPLPVASDMLYINTPEIDQQLFNPDSLMNM